MRQIGFTIDDNCENCTKALSIINKVWKNNNKAYYGVKNLKTDLPIVGLTIRPDYNGSGMVTHYHVEAN